MSQKRFNPPKLAIRFFKWFCDPRLHQYLEGDLLELFERNLQENGSRRAKWRFTLEVLKLFRPSVIKSLKFFKSLNQAGMFKNYFKVSFRNILRNKTFSLLNVSGLSVGIASCLLILLYVNNELSYDRYNSNYENTYRVIHYDGEGTDEIDFSSVPTKEYQVWHNAPVAPALKAYFPEIESVFRFTSPSPWLVEYKGKTFSENNNIVFADSTAFDVFDWPVLAGDAKTALIRPNTIVLTKKLAEKYFGDENPIGKTLIMDNEDPFEVTAVVDIPTNSHFRFDGFISMSTFYKRRPGIFTSWGYVDFYTYFTLKPNTNIESLTKGVRPFLEQQPDAMVNYHIAFEPLSSAYLHSDAGRQPGPVGSMNNIYIFASVAIFILLIACINFMNLSTARSVERAKEVAIRKTIGSSRGSLVGQFLVEAVLIASLAALLASILAFFGHSLLEAVSGKTLPVSWIFTPMNVLLSLVGIVFLGVLAGSYPAFILSNFKPIGVLKGSFKSSANGIWLRKSMVVLQFSLSIILLVGATVVASQLDFLQKHDLGFDSERMVVIDYGYDYQVQLKIEYLKEQFLNHPNVEKVSVSRATPGDFFPNAGTAVTDPVSGELAYKGPAIYEVDEDFVPTYEMEIVAGRNFSRDFLADSANALMVNESAAKMFGYPNPEDIVGKSFRQWGREGKVVGVVADFNYVSLHENVEPLSIRYGTRYNTSMFSLKLKSDDYARTLNELEDIWSNVVPHRPFDSHFLDQNFNTQYEADERFGMIFSIFSGLAIFVACLGLFGLTIYSTAQRAKEIGVRKVLGASVSSIVTLLSKDFTVLFIISLFIALPVAWFAMKNWLDGFAYRIDLGWGVFAMAAFITLSIALVTMSIKTISAALSNPVDALRDE